MESKTFTLEEFEAAVRQQEVPVVVNFFATWSVACLMNKDRIEVLAKECGDEAIVGYVDVDELEELTERFGIITLPTTLIFYKEQIAKQYMGIQEPETLYEAIQNIAGVKKEVVTEQKKKEEKILNSPYK